MLRNRFDLTNAIEGVHYTLGADGRVYPIVRGGDGPTEPIDLESLIGKLLDADGVALPDETLAAIETPALEKLVKDLDAGFAAARANLGEDPTDAELDALELVKLARSVAAGQVTARTAEKDARKARLAALDAGTEGEPAPEGEPGGEPGAGGEPEGEPGGGEPGAPAGGEPAPEGAPGTEPTTAGGAPKGGGRPSLALLSTEGRQPEPGEGGEPKKLKVVASGGLRDTKAGQEIVLSDFAEEFSGLHQALQVQNPSESRRVYLGKAPMRPAPNVVVMPEGETNGNAYIDKAVALDTAWREELTHLVASGQVTSLRAGAVFKASGGTCVVPEPSFALEFVGQRGTCFVDSLPTVVNKRPISFYKWFETRLDQANPWVDGMDNVTEAQDAAGYGDPDIDPEDPGGIPEGGAPYKHCVKIDCPTPVTTSMEANYKCVIYGRFQAISFPEYTRVFDTSTSLWWDVYRDTWAIQKFVAKAVALGHKFVLNASVYNAVRALKAELLRLLARVRSAHKDDSLTLVVVAPMWLKYQLAAGMAIEMDLTGDKLKLTPDQVWALVATEGIDLRSYCTNAGPTTTGAQSTVLSLPTNSLAAWPTQTRLLVYPQGGVFRQPFGGDVSFGLTETLYKTNDYGTFMETFETIDFRTDDLWVIDVNLCDSGTQGGSVVKTC